MRAGLVVVTSAFFMLPLASLADPCGDVVADTIAEIRAGAGRGWGDDVESLVRAAAGSACIKARSERYFATALPAVIDKESVAQTPSGVASDPATEKTGSEASGSDRDESAEDDDNSWSVGGLTFRSMSGSPTQKPYERARQTKKEEQ